MALTLALVGSGKHHAAPSDPVITAGAGSGQIAAAGLNALMTVLLPFTTDVTTPAGFADQLYVTAKSNDGLVTDVRLDATPVADSAAGKVLRLRVDVSALPASLELLVEAHHTIGR